MDARAIDVCVCVFFLLPNLVHFYRAAPPARQMDAELLASVIAAKARGTGLLPLASKQARPRGSIGRKNQARACSRRRPRAGHRRCSHYQRRTPHCQRRNRAPGTPVGGARVRPYDSSRV